MHPPIRKSYFMSRRIHHNKTKTFLKIDNFKGAKFMWLWFMFLKNCFLVHDMMIINYEIITVYIGISECVRDHWKKKQMQVIYLINFLSSFLVSVFWNIYLTLPLWFYLLRQIFVSSILINFKTCLQYFCAHIPCAYRD